MAMKNNKMQVEYIDIEELKTYANNAKIHTAEQIGQIKKSIEEFGFNDPIGIWNNKTIIEGHGRLIAAQELGMKKVPVIRLDELSEDEFRAYNLIHNQLTLNSGFDFDILGEELENIFDYDMEQFGFSHSEVAEYFDKDYEEEREGKIGTTIVNIVVSEEDRSKAEALLDRMGYKYEVR